jgi:hypothetical protein
MEPSSAHRDPPGDDRTLRLETALRRSEKLAMAGRFAASVMHEINNPSQAIGDLVYLIAKDADRPDLVRARAALIEEQLFGYSTLRGRHSRSSGTLRARRPRIWFRW